MAAPIKIEVTLGTQQVAQTGAKIKSALDRELNTGVDTAGVAGQKIGNALFSNIKVNLEKIGPLAKQAGSALTAAVTLPILGIGAAAIKIGFDFEKSMNDLTAATKPTNEQLAKATALAKQLGNDLSLPGISANDAAAAMTTLAKAGLTLDQSMQAVKGSLQLATAAGIDAAKAAEIQADAINTFKLSASDASRVADLLSASANSTSGEITDVAQALKQAGSAAALLKIPIEDTVTALGLLSAQSGVRGADAGTSLKTALIQLTNPTSAAKEAMKKLGLTFFDAQGHLKPLRQLVEEYTAKTAKLTDQQKLQTATTLAGTDGQRALNLVLGAGVEAYDKIKKATTEAGAAQQLAAAKAQGGVGAWEAFKSSLETLALTIFDIIKGPLISLLSVLNDVINFIGDLPQSVQTAIVVFAALAAAIGPLLVVLGSVLSAAIAIAGFFGATLTVTFSGFLAVLAPVIAVLAAVAAGAVGLYLAWKNNFLGIRQIALDAFNGIAAFVQTQFGEIKKQFDEILPLLKQTTATALAEIQKFWADHGQQIIAVVKSMWEIVKTVVSTAIKEVGNIIKLILQVINGDWKGAWDTALNIISTWYSAFISILAGLGKVAFNALSLLGSVISNALGFLVQKTVEIGVQITQGLVNGISSGSQAIYNKLKEIALGALEAAKVVLGIASPSKEFQLIGEFVGEGFIAGLTKSQGAIEKAIRKSMTDHLKESKKEIRDLTAEIGGLLRATPEQFKADRQIAQLESLKNKLKEVLSLREQFGIKTTSLKGLNVDQELARLQLQKQVQEHQPVFDLTVPNSGGTDTAGQEFATIAKLDEKYADLAATLKITTEAKTNYERVTRALGGELAGLDQNEKDQLLFFAKQKDEFEAAQKQAEQYKQTLQSVAQSVGQSFTRIFTAFTRDGFRGGLKAIGQELKNFAGNLLSQIIGGFSQQLANSVVGAIFGGGSPVSGGSGGGGILGTLLGGIFGNRSGGGSGGSSGGLLGSIFGGSTSSSSGSGGIFGNLLGSIFGRGGTAPFNASAGSSSGGLFGNLLGGIKNLFGGGIEAPAAVSARSGGVGSTISSALGLGGVGSFKNIFSGFGFGAKDGSGGALAGLAPLLGIGLGSSLGGQSTLGKIIGGIGGGLIGVGLTAVPAALAGATTGLGGLAASLFSNPFTAIAGAGLLVGALLLGKAKQRKADEQLVDTYWVEYMNKTKDLTAQVNGDQIDGAQALQEALESRQEAINLISQIKTKSVRESRLAHQIPDVDRLFLEPLKAAIEAQKKRAVVIKNIIPEFATGGIVPGVDLGYDSVLAMLRPNEVILNQAQQARIKAMAGTDIFGRAGVPGFGSPASALTRNGHQAYALGGIVQRPVAPVQNGAVVIDTLSVELVAGTDVQSKFFVNGGRTTDGRKVVANNYKIARREREV